MHTTTGMFFAFLLSLHQIFLACNGYWPPEQIHISLGLTPDQISFNWLTWDAPDIVTSSLVRIGTESSQSSSLTMNISGEASLFTDCGSQRTNRTIHTVYVSNLEASKLYYYQVGDIHYGFSDVYSFKTGPNAVTLESTLPNHFLIYGDMGTVNTQACGPATEYVLNGDINAVIHVGDMAYNMYEQNGTTGDEFMNDIQTMAANTPYMAGMGNHEANYNFSHYTQRFKGQPLPNASYGAPQSVWTQSGKLPNNWFYSFNYGLVHFISISSEIYFTFPWMANIQYEWLISDLKQANDNRTNAPWVIAYHHRPLYCTATGSECEDQAFVMRNGVKNSTTGEYMYGLEKVYYDYGVDIIFNGHIHAYERTYDIYLNQTEQKTTNMKAPTYIINGDAGNREGHHYFNQTEIWSAYRTNAYSFCEMKVFNSTHVKLKQIEADSELPPDEQGKTLDEVWLVQENHGPFSSSIRDDIKSGGSKNSHKTVTYDAYDVFNIKMKTVDPNHDKDEIVVEYISNDKNDYRGVNGVYF